MYLSLLTHFANYLLQRQSPPLYPQVFLPSRIFILWRRKGLFTAAVGQLEQVALCNMAKGKQAQTSERAEKNMLSNGEVLSLGTL